MKKAQLTVFIILGLIILLTFGLFITYSSYLKRSRVSGQDITSLSSKQSSMVKSYVESCLDMAALKTLIRFGYQGGEFDFLNPMWYKTMNGQKLAFGLKYGYNLIPSKEEVQARLEGQMNKEIANCIDLASFSKYGLNISEMGGIKSNFVLGAKSTIVNVEYPLMISDSGIRESVISDFSREYPLELAKDLVLAFNLVEQIKDSPDSFDLSKLDLSCNRIMACYKGGGFLRIISYNSYGVEPFYIYQFAIDKEILPACTSMENLNRGVCR